MKNDLTRKRTARNVEDVDDLVYEGEWYISQR